MFRVLTAGLLLASAAAVPAQAAPLPRPKLIVAISVDQYSADLFAEFRQHYVAGLKRLTQGGVYPSGYQSHAATETCPGHSTILTGSRPARTGIIANNWIDARVTRGEKGSHGIYCAEDESVPGSTQETYTPSVVHLKVPTLGDRLKAANMAGRVVSVAGKDRAAIMMGGHRTDQIWFWDAGGSNRYITLADHAGAPVPAAVAVANARAAALIAKPPAAAVPRLCAARNVAVPVGTSGAQVGRIVPRAPGDTAGYRASPDFDRTTADLAIALIGEMRLGRGEGTDVLAIGLSANDYVGHRYGTEGGEMCAQQVALDETVGRILTALDATKAPYEVVLTADHGGTDTTERNAIHGIVDARRIPPTLTAGAIGRAIGAELGIAGDVLAGDIAGDLYLTPQVPAALRPQVLAMAKARLMAQPEVEAVFSAVELRRMALPKPPSDEWDLAQRFRASFDPERSGDLMVALRPHVMPIADPGKGYVSTHGSPWNYDRRVPILVYAPGMTGYEQPLPVETVDILPTLAATIGLTVPAAEIDGHCLDLDAGPGTTCPAGPGADTGQR